MTNSSNSAGYFRRLTVMETFSRLVFIFVDSAHARMFIKLACLMVVPCTFVGMILVKYIVSTSVYQTNDTHNSVAYFLENWAAICKLASRALHMIVPSRYSRLGLFSLSFLVGMNHSVLITGSKLFFHNCAAILSDAAIMYTVTELYVGNTHPSWTTGLHVALRNVHTLFLAGLIIWVTTLLGYLCLVAPGIWIAIAMSMTTPAIVIENKSAWDSLQRSVQLTQGFRWYILACLAIIFTLNYMVSHLLNMILSGSESAMSMWFSVWGYFVHMIPAAIFVPALAILKAIIYISIRGEKEQLNADMLVQEMGHVSLLSPSQIFEYQQVATADATDLGRDGVAMGESSSSSIMMGESPENSGPAI